MTLHVLLTVLVARLSVLCFSPHVFTKYTQLQQVAETKHSQNTARDSTAQLLPQPDEVTEKRRPHSYFYCTVAMIFVFIFCFDFLFLLLCLLPAAWYAHKVCTCHIYRHTIISAILLNFDKNVHMHSCISTSLKKYVVM